MSLSFSDVFLLLVIMISDILTDIDVNYGFVCNPQVCVLSA